MDREIKFRAYDNMTQQMYPNIQNHINDEVFAFGNMLKNGRFEIMQFTSLKDRNGKEIYEGDIVKTWYSRDASGTDIIETEIEVKYEIEDWKGKSGFEIFMLQNCEVVGNIFEQLEEKKGGGGE